MIFSFQTKTNHFIIRTNEQLKFVDFLLGFVFSCSAQQTYDSLVVGFCFHFWIDFCCALCVPLVFFSIARYFRVGSESYRNVRLRCCFWGQTILTLLLVEKHWQHSMLPFKLIFITIHHQYCLDIICACTHTYCKIVETKHMILLLLSRMSQSMYVHVLFFSSYVHNEIVYSNNLLS